MLQLYTGIMIIATLNGAIVRHLASGSMKEQLGHQGVQAGLPKLLVRAAYRSAP